MSLSIDTLVKRFDAIKGNRSNWEAHWQQCANYCLPQKAVITETRAPGTKLKTDIYDSTPIQSVQIFAAGLQSYLTNPSSRWFALRMRNRQLMDVPAVLDWLKECEETIFDYLNSSNFNQVISEDYIDFGVFGNSTLYEEEDVEDAIAFSVRPIREIYFLANSRGRIDTVYRYFTFTARQAWQQWGENAGKKVKDLLDAGKVEDPIPFLHIVLPRAERNVTKRDAKNKPFASLYIEPDTKKILSEGGYEEFPYHIGRCYKVSDSEYAYSPASLALADIKMLNQMSRDILEASQKALNPPVILPHDGYLLPFKTSPKAINFKNMEGSEPEKVEVLDMQRDIPINLEMQNQRRQMVERVFSVDLFLMLASLPERQRTATEIVERVNERMLILGPLLGRLMHEKLSPIIVRTFNILLRLGKLPPVPEELENQEYQIEYISPLAKAQKASETRSMADMLLSLKQVAELNPMVIDNFDLDKYSRRIAGIHYEESILRGDDAVVAIRQEREQQAQIEREAAQLKQGGEGAKAIAEAEKIIMEGSGAGK